MVEANPEEVNDMPDEMNGFDRDEGNQRVSNAFFSQNIFARQEGTNELNAAVP